MSRAPGMTVGPKNPLKVTAELFLLFFRTIKRILRWLLRPLIHQKPQLFLSRKVKIKAHMKFNKLLNKFRKYHRREPTRDELFRIIINTSHITIRRRGKRGHWGRQKVRKMLLEEHGMPYKMK